MVAYGWTDFKRWFNDPRHHDEVETLKKDVLKWSLKTDHLKVSRNLNLYYKRLIRIQTTFQHLFDILGKPQDVIDLGKRISTAKTTYIKKHKGSYGKLSDNKILRKFYGHELLALHVILSEIEIDLGIYKPNACLYKFSSCLYFYRELCKQQLNFFILTKETREAINKKCEAASTEYVYCKTLLESRYNWSVKTDNYNSTPEDDDGRRTALNIRNAIRYIETAKYRLSNAQTDSTHQILDKADRWGKRAKIIAIIGLIVTVAGLGVTLWDVVRNICSI